MGANIHRREDCLLNEMEAKEKFDLSQVFLTRKTFRLQKAKKLVCGPGRAQLHLNLLEA